MSPTSTSVTGSTSGQRVTFQFASDLHLEWLQTAWPGERLIEPVPGADALLLAGDIANMSEVTELFHDWPVPVFMIPGNHEFYGHDLARQRELIAQGFYNKGSFTVLDNTAVKFKGVRILGTTLWTDYRLFPHLSLPEALAVAQAALSGSDHSRIKFKGKLFKPEDALGLHHAARTWLREQLGTRFDGPTVVMSHHAPSIRSLAERWRTQESSCAFVSEMHLTQCADFWVHGHLHDCADYELGPCRVLANPRGYGRGAAFAETAADMDFENKAFRPDATLDVPTGAAWRAYSRTRTFEVAPRWHLTCQEPGMLAGTPGGAWAVTDGALCYGCSSEEAARWLLNTLNAVARRGLKGVA